MTDVFCNINFLSSQKKENCIFQKLHCNLCMWTFTNNKKKSLWSVVTSSHDIMSVHWVHPEAGGSSYKNQSPAARTKLTTHSTPSSDWFYPHTTRDPNTLFQERKFLGSKAVRVVFAVRLDLSAHDDSQHSSDLGSGGGILLSPLARRGDKTQVRFSLFTVVSTKHSIWKIAVEKVVHHVTAGCWCVLSTLVR